MNCLYVPPFVHLFMCQWTLGLPLPWLLRIVLWDVDVQTSLEDPACHPCGYRPKGELLEHMVVLFFIFWGTTLPFFMDSDHFTFLSAKHSFNFSRSLGILVTFCFVFIIAIPIGVTWFGFAFPWWLMMLGILSCTRWLSCISFGEKVYSSLLSI